MLGNAVAVERAWSVAEQVVELVGSVEVQGVEQVEAVEPVLIVVELVEFVVVQGVEPVVAVEQALFVVEQGGLEVELAEV